MDSATHTACPAAMARGSTAVLKMKSQILRKLNKQRRSQQRRHLLPFNHITVKNVPSESNLISEAKFDSLIPIIQVIAAF